MVINLAIFREIYICELSKTTLLWRNYFCKFETNLFRKLPFKYLFQLRRTNSVWISASYVILHTFFSTVKHSSTSLKGYVSQVCLVKQARSGNTEYFDFTFETEEERVRVVCFSPEKWEKINKFQHEGQSCITGSVTKIGKPSEFKLTNN